MTKEGHRMTETAKGKVDGILDNIAETFRPDIERAFIARHGRHLNLSRKQDGIFHLDRNINYRREDEYYEAHRIYGDTFTNIHTNHGIVTKSFKDRSGDHISFYQFTDGKTAMRNLSTAAKKFADAVIADFRAKVSDKLFNIISARVDKVKQIRGGVHNMISHNSIRFEFHGGTGFTTLAQIVNVVNSHGTWFQRYPLTFHDVTVDGEKMKNPSEAKLKKAFTGEAIVKKGPTVHRGGGYWGGATGRGIGVCVGSAMGAQRFWGKTTENWDEVTCKKCLKYQKEG